MLHKLNLSDLQFLGASQGTQLVVLSLGDAFLNRHHQEFTRVQLHIWLPSRLRNNFL